MKTNKLQSSSLEDQEFARILVQYYKYYQKECLWFNNPNNFSMYRPVKYDRVWFNEISRQGGTRVNWLVLHKLYIEGFFIQRKLKCSYCEFCDYMVHGIPSRYYRLIAPREDLRKSRWFWGYGWTLKNDFKDNHFRQKQKYQKNKSKNKDKKSEEQIAKESWRNKVKDSRDQGQGYYARKTRKSCIKDGNKSERRAVKSKLQSGWFCADDLVKFEGCYLDCTPENDWDNWLSRKRREWVNPWDWD
ncbi:hypothetical protein N9948_00250 [bacterium]|nr:hypothetical protein [bacterium]